MFTRGFFRSKVKNVIDEVQMFNKSDDSQRFKNVLFDEMLKVCLDPEELVARLTRVFLKEAGRSHGHVHFYFKSKSDHVILLWSEGGVDKILAKSGDSGKGQYTHWVDSEFSRYERKDVLNELHNEIERIEIDEGFHMTWSSYAGLLNWLLESLK